MSFIRFKNPKPPSFNWNQNLNWEKDVRLINILGDSYTDKNRFKEFIVDSNPRCYVDIRPHATIADSVESISCTETTTTWEGVFVNFLSIGGYNIRESPGTERESRTTTTESLEQQQQRV